MSNKFSIPFVLSMLLIIASCSGQVTPVEKQSKTANQDLKSLVSKKDKPHRYGGWYCPDNFGFVPVDIQKIDEVPAIANRLPTEQELRDNMSLIKVDTAKYPNARAMEMDLPRVASIYSERKGISELIIVIQAIIVQEDTVVGYRFANGGNGSAWLSDVTFLSEEEVASKGAQPFYFSKSVLKGTTEDIWNALGTTGYFKQLGEKFDKKGFFSSEWNYSESRAHLSLDTKSEKAIGSVGMLFGNYYMHIDYIRNGFHYSEKLLIGEDKESNTTELIFASGPYPDDFEKEKSSWDSWVEEVKKANELD